MSIIFTSHAKDRMNERGISREQIEECIRYPEKVFMESEKIRHFQKSFFNDTLEVVAEFKNRHYIIITVFVL